MDFQTVDSLVSAQELTLKESDLDPPVLSPLKFVKFQNVSSLTVFVQSNQGGGDTTIIKRLRCVGVAIGATNMKEFKRVAGEKGEAHD